MGSTGPFAPTPVVYPDPKEGHGIYGGVYYSLKFCPTPVKRYAGDTITDEITDRAYFATSVPADWEYDPDMCEAYRKRYGLVAWARFKATGKVVENTDENFVL